MGLSEWYVPAILAYHAIHDKVATLKEKETVMREFLESKTLSMNSKTPLKPGYWNKVKGKRLQTIYSYIKFSESAGNIFDVKTLTEAKVRDIDLLTYSFPCQDLSIQGKGKGIEQGTRSGLLLEIERYIRSLKDSELPKYLLMENVKAISNKNHIVAFKKWLKYLNTRGYKTDWKVLNSQHFGSPQRRERVFALSSRVGAIKLPKSNLKQAKVLKDIMDKNFNEEYRLDKLEKYDKTPWQNNRGANFIRRCNMKHYTSFASETYIYDQKHVGCTLTAQGANSRIKVLEGNKIRVINPKEAYKYMGFTAKDYNKINKLGILTSTQMLFTAGNSISVEVLESIFEELI